ncbi:hypothetical protein Mapa_012088 [Marchantia paleacea]|nr:hypothetical protein Mapa_012088 [Marchantia paleacea]
MDALLRTFPPPGQKLLDQTSLTKSRVHNLLGSLGDCPDTKRELMLLSNFVS